MLVLLGGRNYLFRQYDRHFPLGFIAAKDWPMIDCRLIRPRRLPDPSLFAATNGACANALRNERTQKLTSQAQRRWITKFDCENLSWQIFPFQPLKTSATMDVQKLHVVLQQSFSPDASLRGPAEETIRNLKHIKGATALLLQVAAEKQVRVRPTRTPRIQFSCVDVSINADNKETILVCSRPFQKVSRFSHHTLPSLGPIRSKTGCFHSAQKYMQRMLGGTS